MDFACRARTRNVGLKRVLGVVDVPQRAQANSQHHRPMPPQQGLEGRLVVLAHECAEQGTVGLFAVLVHGGELPDVPDNCPQLRGRHRYLSPQEPVLLLCSALPAENVTAVEKEKSPPSWSRPL